MRFNEELLILDNFRSVLKDYSVDIQDVVRSAILDGVDISDYISQCADNPYRLDQIRLSLKESLPREILNISKGDLIYQIRELKRSGFSLLYIEEQLSRGNLSDEYMKYLISWVKDGVKISGINLAIIPKGLLSTFDYGLRNGFDMRVFNNGYTYTSGYIRCCFVILKNGKSVSPFKNGKYSIDVMNTLGTFSNTSKIKWNELISNIDSTTPLERVEILIKIIKAGGMFTEKLNKKKEKENEYVYSNECLEIIYKAYLSKLDVNKLLESTTDAPEMRSIMEEMDLEKNRKLGIRLRKF